MFEDRTIRQTESQYNSHTKLLRPVTPNPFYHHQKRKLLLKYKEQLVEKEIKEEIHEKRKIMEIFER